MNNIETNLLSLIFGNKNGSNGIQVIENKTGLNFMDMLYSRINETEDFSVEKRRTSERVNEINESMISDNSPKMRHSIQSEEKMINEEKILKENKPVVTEVKDTGKENNAEERSVKESTAGKMENKASRAEGKESEVIREKRKILKDLEKMCISVEGIGVENLGKPELKHLIKIFGKMMDIVNPSIGNSPLKLQLKDLLSRMKELIENLNLKQKNSILKEIEIKNLKSEIERFNSLIKRAIDEMRNGKPAVKETLSKITFLVDKIAGKTRGDNIEHAVSDTDNKGQVVKNTTAVLNKIDILLSETVTENGNGSLETGSEKDGQNNFNLNYMKNFSSRNIGGNNTGTVNNSRFSQQMQSIIENAKVVVKDGRNGSFAVKLYPKELGMVNINLGLEHGVVNGKFFVENAEARELLMENLNFIREQLEKAGINIGEFEVNVNHQGEMFTGDHQEETFFTLPETEREVAKEYNMNSLLLHDGEFNMII